MGPAAAGRRGSALADGLRALRRGSASTPPLMVQLPAGAANQPLAEPLANFHHAGRATTHARRNSRTGPAGPTDLARSIATLQAELGRERDQRDEERAEMAAAEMTLGGGHSGGAHPCREAPETHRGARRARGQSGSARAGTLR